MEIAPTSSGAENFVIDDFFFCVQCFYCCENILYICSQYNKIE
jgi:hypothetical protein